MDRPPHPTDPILALSPRRAIAPAFLRARGFSLGLGLGLAFVAAVPLLHAAEPGYLPSAGPPPLRFVAPRAAPPQTPVELPPPTPTPAAASAGANASDTAHPPGSKPPGRLDPGTSPSTAISVSSSTSASTARGSTNVNASANPSPATAPPVATGPTEAEAQALAQARAQAQAEAQASLQPGNPAAVSPAQAIMPQPQLFMQYFTPDYVAGSNGFHVVVPVSFLPPQPRAINPSSTATYQSPPAEKPNP